MGQKRYTAEDLYALPEERRAELIDGQIYDMAPPRRIHQKLVSQFTKVIAQYIDAHGGTCEVYPAPFAVFLNSDDESCLQPDISVVCDPAKLNEYGCNGAPDWIIEIVSPSTERNDYGLKFFKYRSAGVREYWIVNPSKQTVNVYDFWRDLGTKQYSFDETVPICIYEDLSIKIEDLLSRPPAAGVHPGAGEA